MNRNGPVDFASLRTAFWSPKLWPVPLGFFFLALDPGFRGGEPPLLEGCVLRHCILELHRLGLEASRKLRVLLFCGLEFHLGCFEFLSIVFLDQTLRWAPQASAAI